MNPQTVVLFVVLLGVLITVHELGHFLIAKALNVKVLRFSVGFGPKIVGFTRGETEYRIAWIPLGGYVKMAGELPYDEENPEDAKRGFLAQPPWKRALIVIGGPAFNLIFPIFIYFFVFYGSFEQAAPVIGYVQPGLPAAEAGIQAGDRVLAVEGRPVASFARLMDRVSQRPNVETRILLERDGERLEKVLTPSAAHSADVFSEIRGVIGAGLISPEPVVGVPANGAAWQAGLRTFDRIVRVNGQPVADLNVLAKVLEDAAGVASVQVARMEPLELPGIGGAQPRLIDLELPLQEGEGLAALGAEQPDVYVAYVYPGGPAATAGLRREDRLLAVDGRPLRSFSDFQIAVARAEARPFTLSFVREGETKQVSLAQGKFDTTDLLGQKIPIEGVGIDSSGWPPQVYSPKLELVTEHVGLGESARAAVEQVPRVIGLTLKVIGRLFTGEMPPGTVGGPIMMLQLTGKTAEAGYRSYLSLMGAISINLGIMNLLPIPILDGFALLAALWEAIRRRPIPMRAREIANMVGLAMLLIIMVLVFKNDLTR